MPSAWWFGGLHPHVQFSKRVNQVGQVRLQAGLLKSGLRDSERHITAKSLTFC